MTLQNYVRPLLEMRLPHSTRLGLILLCGLFGLLMIEWLDGSVLVSAFLFLILLLITWNAGQELSNSRRVIREPQKKPNWGETDAVLHTLLQHTPVGIAYFDRTLHFTYINQFLADMNGFSREEHLGQPLEAIVAPEAAAIIRQIMQQVLETGEPQLNLEIIGETRASQGRVLCCLANYYPVRAENGEMLGVGVTVTEITERKQTEQALMASESRFRQLAEGNTIGVIFWDADGKILEANDAFLQTVGYGREDLEAGHLSWKQMTPPEQLYFSEQSIAQMKRTGTTPPLAKQYIRKDGSRVNVLLGGVMFEGSQDRGASFVLDLSEQNRVQQELQETLQRLNFHVENTPLAVIERDRNFRITRWSSSAERIFGWRADEVIGQGAQDFQFVYEPDLAQVQMLRERLLSGLENQNVSRNRSYRKDGSVIHCEWYNSALVDETGQLVSVLSLVLDVTDQKRAEAERDHLLTLEKAARAEAEAANRIKDEFLAVLSHELRTPLNPILGWSRLLRSRIFDPETTHRALETIERNARIQTQLIEDLLDVSRILRGKMRLNITPVDLISTIKAALETVQLSAEAKSIQIESNFRIREAQVAGDAGRLQQVFWNLLSNAIKFTPPGGKISLKLSLLEVTGFYAAIEIADTGQGISPEFLPHVFDCFRQADSTITRSFGGLGLGLAIVRHLVELHGGRVRAESEGLGLGSTFIVQLPLMNTFPKAITESVPAPPCTNLQGLRILIVDDEPDTRDFLMFLLQEFGGEIVTASSAKTALEKIVLTEPDILISDIGMPEMDGYQLMQQVRSLPLQRGRNTPAIALTAYAQESDAAQALAVGFQCHLSKPVDPLQLLAAISELTGRF